jgi:ketosteroid isomerase-like protein
MSQENVEIVRRFFEVRSAFLRGEADGATFEEVFDPQVEVSWHDQQTYPDTPQQLRGATAVVAFAEQYREGWLDVVPQLLELSEAQGGRVFAFSRQSARGRHSGVPILIHFFEVFTVEGGRVRKEEFFRHRTDAEEAAGLSE